MAEAKHLTLIDLFEDAADRVLQRGIDAGYFTGMHVVNVNVDPVQPEEEGILGNPEPQTSPPSSTPTGGWSGRS